MPIKRITLIYDKLDLGGQQIILLALAGELQARGWEVELLSFMPGELEAKFREQGITVTVLPAGPKILRIAAIRNRLLQNPPLVVHTHLFSAGFWGRIAAKLAGIPVIIHTEGGMPFREKRWKRVPVERLLNHISDRFVCVAQAVKEHLVDIGGMNPDSLLVIPNSFSSDMLSTQPIRPIQNAPVIFSAGRMATIKGYDLLIQAVSLLEGFKGKLVLAGSGPETENLRNLAFSLGIGEQVEFLGYREDIPQLLDKSDLYVTASRSEGMSISILEAMAVGVPVIATDVGGNKELLGETGRIVPAENPQALATAIKAAIEDTSTTQELAVNARKRVETNFNLDRMVTAYEDLFYKCLAEKGIRINQKRTESMIGTQKAL